MSETTVHVFGIVPGSIGEEIGYGYPFWHPKPVNGTDEEIIEWEDMNPKWGLREEIGELDEDEVVSFLNKDDRVWRNLEFYIREDGDVDRIKEIASHCKEFILIFDLGHEPGSVDYRSTEGALYAGEFISYYNPKR
ncbi:MAG: hypothetical protein P1V20_20910 [Verrucomicrobiales bacterium]|nr:hypothetical protein [Verrucomicrobiales bacterium]